MMIGKKRRYFQAIFSDRLPFRIDGARRTFFVLEYIPVRYWYEVVHRMVLHANRVIPTFSHSTHIYSSLLS
jgi:hypothetical protein